MVLSACGQPGTQPAATPPSSTSASVSAAKPALAVGKPEPSVVVREFYQAYLQKFAGGNAPGPDIMNRYLTEKFQTEQKETTDEDVIIRGSDFDEAWARNVTVSELEKESEGKARVLVELKGAQSTQKLRVTVLAQANSWKIDEVGLFQPNDANAASPPADGNRASNVTTRTVAFARGASSAEYEATIAPGETHIYVMNVRKGQYFGAQTYNEDYGVEFKVRRKGGAELENPPGNVKWGGEAPATGDYEFVIGNLKKSTSYTITLHAE